MPALNTREISRRYELEGPERFVAHFKGALAKGHLKPTDVGIADLAEGVLGREVIDSLRRGETLVIESFDGVDSTVFSNITGQLLISAVLQEYTPAARSLSAAVPTFPIRLRKGEKIPGFSGYEDLFDPIHEGMPYPNVGFGEDYIETPPSEKRGAIVNLTREAMIDNLTGARMLQQAQSLSRRLLENKEKRVAKVVAGLVNNFRWRGTAYNTYYATGGGGPWVNRLASNPLVNWRSVDKIEQLFANMSDPHTGEPIDIVPSDVLVMPARLHESSMVLGKAREVRTSTDSGDTVTLSDNPLSAYNLMTNKWIYRELVASGITADNAKDYWFMGNFARAFAYFQIWGLETMRAPSGNEREYSQDFIFSFKVSEYGVAGVMDPREVANSYNT